MAKEYYEFDTDEHKITANVTERMKTTEKAENMLAKVDKWKLFKQTVSMIASGCASVVMSKYLKANMPESSTMFEKAVMGVGTYFLTGVVGANVSKYVDGELDEWRDSIMSIKEASDDGELE